MRVLKVVMAALVVAAAVGCEQPSSILLPSRDAAVADAPTQPGSVVFSTTSTCAPGGWYIGVISAYNHIATGNFTVDDCWSPNRSVYTTSSTCGVTRYGYKFGYAGSIAQSVVIPADFHDTYFELSYRLDFDDPNNDGVNNRFVAKVVDMTTNTTLAQESYNGSLPDLACSTRTLSFSGDLAGHTLRVIFNGSIGYSNTTIRVMRVTLWQYF